MVPQLQGFFVCCVRISSRINTYRAGFSVMKRKTVRLEISLYVASMPYLNNYIKKGRAITFVLNE